MKNKILIVLLLSFIGNAYSQNKNSIKEIAEAAEKSFTWDIEKLQKGTMMFLDVPYQRENNSVEYLTLSVAKDKTQKRPAFLSIIIPNNIVKSNGIFIKFGNDKLEEGNPVRVQFERCNDETCTARIIGGYTTPDGETKESVDIFQKFLDFKHVYFLFVYPDGSHKSVTVPLFSFQKQYRSL